MSKFVPIAVIATAVLVYYCFLSSDGYEPESIKGQRILVTGASSGIGEQLAYQYCKLGAKVAIAARRLQRLEAVAQKCKDLGAAQVVLVQADLGNAEDRSRLIKEVKEQLGGLDQLLLNHAVVSMGLWTGSHENMTTFMKQLDINFVSFVDLASQALEMLTASRGRIGVVSSASGKVPFAGMASYSADKFALQGFFGALAQDLRLRDTGVSITICIIGPVDTEIGQDGMSEKQRQNLRPSFIKYIEATAEETAVAIMHGVDTRQREIYYGRIAYVTTLMHKMFPQTIEDMFANMAVEI